MLTVSISLEIFSKLGFLTKLGHIGGVDNVEDCYDDEEEEGDDDDDCS